MVTEIEKYHKQNHQLTNLYIILLVLGMLLGLVKDALFGYYFFIIPAGVVILICLIFLALPYPLKLRTLTKSLFYLILLVSLFYYQLLFRYDSALLLFIPMTITLGIYFDFSYNRNIIFAITGFITLLLLIYYATGIKIIQFPVTASYKNSTDIANYIVLVTWTLFSVYISYKHAKLLQKYNRLLRQVFDNASSKVVDNESLEELHYLIDTDFTAFYMKFRELYPVFMHKVDKIAPNLVVEELKVIILIFMGYSTRQISELTNSSNSSVEAKKHRIRKKLLVPTEITLTGYLQNI